jgi:hypothetical protein
VRLRYAHRGVDGPDSDGWLVVVGVVGDEMACSSCAMSSLLSTIPIDVPDGRQEWRMAGRYSPAARWVRSGQRRELRVRDPQARRNLELDRDTLHIVYLPQPTRTILVSLYSIV